MENVATYLSSSGLRRQGGPKVRPGGSGLELILF